MIMRLAQDLRYALRTFRRAPLFTVVATVTIALGIAANVTVFSFIDALFLRELPVKGAGRLVRIFGTRQSQAHRAFSYSEYAYLRDHAASVDRLIAHYSTAPLYVTMDRKAGEVQGAVVSANYFPTLQATPYLGRFFRPEEDTVPDRDAVAVVGYDLWRSWFGADPSVVGKAMRINSRIFQIIGVAPRNFRGIAAGESANELWIPTMMLRTGYRWCDAIEDDCTTLDILGRLAPGRGVQQASAELAALTAQLAATQPGKDVSQGAWATPAVGAQMGGFRPVARVLAITAATLLLVGCVNLAVLLMARAQARAKEMAMRLALGAARVRILQQLLTESVLLALLGGALGLILSLATNRLLIGFYTTDAEGYRQWFDMSLDARTLLYAVAIAFATGILFGVLPAFQGARQDTLAAFKGDSGSSSKHFGRSVLVSCQIALSLALLVGAGLLARSVRKIESGQVFDPQHVALLRLRPRLVSYAPDKAQAFQRQVVRRLKTLPGVEALSYTGGAGFVWGRSASAAVALPGEQQAVPGRERSVGHKEIAPAYFATLRIPLVAGREFDDHDVVGSQRMTIVSESLARELWPAGSALGRSILVDGQAHRVVGVARDSQLLDDTESRVPTLYVPYWQEPGMTDSRMCIRVAGDPEVELPRIKAAIASVDPNVPITEAMPMIAQVRGVYTNVRMAKSVVMSAAGLALLLSAIGLYGVLAFMVGRRTREIGIRMAVGAMPRQVLALFLRQGLTLALLGCCGGIALAAVTTRSLASFLYGVPTRDPQTFAAGAVVLVCVAAAAAYLPARRAARVDPMVALHDE